MQEDWTITALIDDLAGRGDAPAIVAVTGEDLTTLSAAGLAAKVRALASGLLRIGVVPGETVGLIAPNGFDWVIARLALGAVGAVAVALDDLASADELVDFVREAGCRRWLTSEGHVAALRRIDSALELIVLGESAAEGTRSWTTLFGAGDRPLPRLAPDAPAMLVYTSGTTGAAKSFVLSYANLAANLRPLVGAKLVGPGDNVLLPLPLHHVYPLVAGLLTPLLSGAVTIFPASAAGPDIVQALKRADAAAIIGVPRLYEAMMTGLRGRLAAHGVFARTAFDLLLRLAMAARRRFGVDLGRTLFRRVRATIAPRLRLLVSGGARLPPEVLWPLVGLGFELRTGYGLAETASIFTGNLPGAERFGSEGRPFLGEVRIADPDETGTGEIQLRGASVLAGYRNNPTANAAAFTGDGWFRTTDLGRLDADGFLFVAGRRSEVIVLGGGKKVDPEGLEKIYGASAAVREIAILERRGGLVALVAPELGGAAPATQITHAIRIALASTARTLPSYERLSGFAVTRTPLPRTRLGKLQRFRLRDLYETALAGGTGPPRLEPTAADRDLLANVTAGRLFEMLEKRYRDRPVSLDAHPLLDVGIDSLEWVSLSLTINERLGITLTETDLADAATVRDLLRRAAAKTAEPAATAPSRIDLAAIDWTAPVGPWLGLAARVLYGLNWLLMRACFRVRADGRANIPANGPWVLVANHASDLDALLLAASIGYRNVSRLYWSGDATRLFSRPRLFSLLRGMRIFPVEERAPSRALALSEKVLSRGDALAWFPEGWRTPDGTLQRFFPGIGELLARVPVPVVPVSIAGSFEALPRQKRMPRPHRVRIVIGKAMSPAELGVGKGALPQEIADHLRDAVSSLGSAAK